MRNDKKTMEDVADLYSAGDTLENICAHLSLSMKEAQYYCWRAVNSPPKPYIKDKKKREEEIKNLQEKKGKEYKEYIYLSYLQGRINKDIYLSAF